MFDVDCALVYIAAATWLLTPLSSITEVVAGHEFIGIGRMLLVKI
jgi:hypothetical protein